MATVRTTRISLGVIVVAIGTAGYGMGVPLLVAIPGIAVGLGATAWLTRPKRQSVPKP